MKRNFVKIIGGMVLAVLVISTSTFLAFTQDDTKSQNGGGRLEGTWDIQVTVRNCQTGAPIRTYAEIETFMSGGTTIVSTTGIPPALKTAGHGICSHAGGNAYRFKFKSFSFDASGNFTGWAIIKHEANLNRSADEYESTGTAEVYAPNGNLLFTGCATETATRFE